MAQSVGSYSLSINLQVLFHEIPSFVLCLLGIIIALRELCRLHIVLVVVCLPHLGLTVERPEAVWKECLATFSGCLL